MDINIPKSCFNIERILSETKYSCHAMFRMRSGVGEAIIYQLSPAVHVAYFDFKAKAYILNNNRRSHMFEINYSLQGRSEHILTDGSVQYIGKDSLYFNRESFHTDELFLPLGYYTGIGILIDLNNLETVSKTLTTHIKLDIPALAEKLLSHGTNFCLDIEPCIQNLQIIPNHLSESAKCAWLRLNVSQLLVYLNDYPFEQKKPIKTYELHHVNIIKDIHLELISNLQTRYTIEELGKQYFISPTKLKSTFKGIYGEPIGSYIKKYKIKHAAKRLRETDLSIDKISQEIGYKNASKFSAAFKEIMTLSPVAFRKKYR